MKPPQGLSDDLYRKAEYWDRFLAIWNGEEVVTRDDLNEVADDIYNLVQEYHRRPRLDGTYCGACNKMDGHPKDRCPNRPMVAKVTPL